MPVAVHAHPVQEIKLENGKTQPSRTRQERYSFDFFAGPAESLFPRAACQSAPSEPARLAPGRPHNLTRLHLVPDQTRRSASRTRPVKATGESGRCRIKRLGPRDFL